MMINNGRCSMAKIISFFNHKGGVGKTTLAYNIAWGLSLAGKKVLMIDADAQCNLTEISVDDKYLYGDEELSDSKYDPDFFFQNNVYSYFLNYIQPVPNQPTIDTAIFEKRNNLKLLSGSIRLAELEETISLSLSGINALSHVPNSTYMALQNLGKDVDYIILDLSPALSATNQLFVMLSDYFIVPVNPSIFSRQALQNLNDIIRQWNRKLSSFDIFSRKIKKLPKLLGIVCQNYRPYSRKDEENTKSAQRFEERMQNLNQCAVELAMDLNSFGMALTPGEFNNLFPSSTPYRIANIPDYNQLSMVSEREKIPVNGINNKILQQHSLNTEIYRQKVQDFKSECEKIVNGLLSIDSQPNSQKP